MNSSKVLVMGCAIAMTSAAFNAQALTAKAGLDACTRAMVDTLSMSVGSQVGYHMDTRNKATGRLNARDIFHLDARNPKTDDVIGRFDCIVSRRAEVLELITLPLSADDARIRAGITY